MHPKARGYFRGPAPYLAMVVCAAVFAPHAWWAFAHKLSTVAYVVDRTPPNMGELAAKSMGGLAGSLALYILPAGILALALGRGAAWRSPRMGSSAWLLALALGPILLTAFFAVVFRLKLSQPYLAPTLIAPPIVFVALSGLAPNAPQLRTLWRALALLVAAALLASPLVAVVLFQRQVRETVDPVQEAAVAGTDAFRQATGKSLRFVGGSDSLGLGAPFYSADGPRLFDFEKPSATPWATEAALKRDGLALICRRAQADCVAFGRNSDFHGATETTLTLNRRFLGWIGPATDLTIIVVPPQS